MKANLRTIIGMLGSVVMASCSTTTIDERDITQIPIEFGSSVSRAAVNDATEMSSFSVWGGYDGTNNSSFASSPMPSFSLRINL